MTMTMTRFKVANLVASLEVSCQKVGFSLGCFFNTSFFKMKPSRFAKSGVPGGSGRQDRHLNRQVSGGLI